MRKGLGEWKYTKQTEIRAERRISEKDWCIFGLKAIKPQYGCYCETIACWDRRKVHFAVYEMKKAN